MKRASLKIAKTLQQVRLWVHPEGLVYGSLYLSVGEDEQAVEDPLTVLNRDWPFLVLKRKNPDEIRFYNRSSIIRVEYEEATPEDSHITSISCHIVMMDGSTIDGMIHEELPSDRARLYDYLNQENNRFLKVYTADNLVCLLNKSYVIQVRP